LSHVYNNCFLTCNIKIIFISFQMSVGILPVLLVKSHWLLHDYRSLLLKSTPSSWSSDWVLSSIECPSLCQGSRGNDYFFTLSGERQQFFNHFKLLIFLSYKAQPKVNVIWLLFLSVQLIPIYDLAHFYLN
jgi:hypothetical protein